MYAYFWFPSNNILVFFFEKKYCSESENSLYIQKYALVIKYAECGGKNIIFLEEGGKVRWANQAACSLKHSSFRVRFINRNYTQNLLQVTPEVQALSHSAALQRRAVRTVVSRASVWERGQKRVLVLVCFCSKLGSFASDGLEASLDAGYRATWVTGFTLQEVETCVLLQNCIRWAAGMTSHIFLCETAKRENALSKIY